MQATLAEMRGREISNQQVGYSYLGRFFQHNIDSLIETVAALLVASVSKITSGRGADVRM